MSHAPRKLLIGLIGAGIQRSLSPAVHEEEARHHDLRLHYQLIDLDRAGVGVEALADLLAAACHMGFAGLNITYPCKQSVVPLLDDLSPEARAIGAVNTVVFRDGAAIGHNTDSTGWAWSLRRGLPQADLSRVVLLGAGGAGSAIADALLRLGATHIAVIDREVNRAEQLAASLNARAAPHGGGFRAEAAADVAAAVTRASGVVHATPTGMDKLQGMALPRDLLRREQWVAEAVYFPIETELLEAARACGCATLDGGGMAAGQAAGAFALFTGLTPDAERMYNHLRRMLNPVR